MVANFTNCQRKQSANKDICKWFCNKTYFLKQSSAGKKIRVKQSTTDRHLQQIAVLLYIHFHITLCLLMDGSGSGLIFFVFCFCFVLSFVLFCVCVWKGVQTTNWIEKLNVFYPFVCCPMDDFATWFYFLSCFSSLEF